MTKTIPQLVAEGAIAFHSVEAGNALLALFPEVPELMRLQADLMAGRGSPAAAARLYDDAAGRFLSAGKILKALVAKSLAWRLERPSREDVVAFHRAVETADHDGSLLGEFLQKMGPVERMALLSRFERRDVPAGRSFEIGRGDDDTGLCLVVGGRLRETRTLTLDPREGVKRESVQTHEENGFFGGMYPFRQEAANGFSRLESLTRCELVVFSKRRLTQLFWKHPSLRQGLERLCRDRAAQEEERFTAVARRGERYPVPVRMTLEVPLAGNGSAPLVMKGRACDLSVSGMSFLVEPEGIEAPPDREVSLPPDADLDVQVKIPLEGITMGIQGRIVRRRRMVVNGYKTLVFGIEFEAVEPRLRGLFFSLASAANGHRA